MEKPYPLRLSIPMEKEQRKHLLVLQHLRSSPLFLILQSYKVFENSSGFQINTFTEGGQSRPEITELTDGNFVCIWQSFHQVYDGSNNDIFGQNSQ